MKAILLLLLCANVNALELSGPTVQGQPITPASVSATTITWGDSATQGVLQANGAIVSKGSVTVTGAGLFSGSVAVGGQLTVAGASTTLKQLTNSTTALMLAVPENGATNNTWLAFKSNGDQYNYGQIKLTPNAISLSLDAVNFGVIGGNVGIGVTAPATTLDVNGSAQFGSGATKSTFTATGALNLVGALGVVKASTQAVFSGYSDLGGVHAAAGQIELGSIAAYKGVLQFDESGNTALSLDNTFDSVSAVTKFRMRTAGTPVTALSIAGTGGVTISTMTGTYGGGSAHVCVTDAGLLFASEAACP